MSNRKLNILCLFLIVSGQIMSKSPQDIFYTTHTEKDQQTANLDIKTYKTLAPYNDLHNSCVNYKGGKEVRFLFALLWLFVLYIILKSIDKHNNEE